MFSQIVKWSKSFKELPWRKNRSLYRTLVSEVMLQQTTVQTVLNYFESFIKEYPDLKSLALASEERLTISWKGLGYYRRARNLKKASEYILQNFNGKIPLDYNELVKIPGIGDYTASAILSIGSNESFFAIDANLERVLSRVFKLKEEKGIKLQKKIKTLLENKEIKKEFKKYGGRAINEALMDLGRNFCKSKKVYCELCPLSGHCQSYKDGTMLSYPVSREVLEKNKTIEIKLLRIIVENKKNEILLYKKDKGLWLEDQFEVPTFYLGETSSFKQYPVLEFSNLELKKYKTVITKYKITNYIFELNYSEWKRDYQKQFPYKVLFKNKKDKDFNISTATQKALNIKSREKR